MKQTAKKVLNPAINFVRNRVRSAVKWAADDAFFNQQEILNQQTQRTIVNQYLYFKSNDITPYKKVTDAGFRVYSQFEEDGTILYILSMIGFRNKCVVEMCCGSGDECMATNLILNHGFDGYLFDGNPENISAAERFFRSKKDCLAYPPVLTQAWITAENVNDLLTRSGCAGEVDVFSLDIDGNDYWVWNAIEAINPRLLVFETNNVIPSDKSLTIEYQPDFDSRSNETDYLGVSLLAMRKLCKTRGYRMIGANRHGFNVFFLREDEGVDFLPEVGIHEVHDNLCTRSAQTRWPLVKDMPWKEV